MRNSIRIQKDRGFSIVENGKKFPRKSREYVICFIVDSNYAEVVLRIEMGKIHINFVLKLFRFYKNRCWKYLNNERKFK